MLENVHKKVIDADGIIDETCPVGEYKFLTYEYT